MTDELPFPKPQMDERVSEAEIAAARATESARSARDRLPYDQHTIAIMAAIVFSGAQEEMMVRGETDFDSAAETALVLYETVAKLIQTVTTD
jgi:hypothetical protein